VGLQCTRLTPDRRRRIILQRDVAIEVGETLDSLIRRTKRLGAHVIAEAIDLIKSELCNTEKSGFRGLVLFISNQERCQRLQEKGTQNTIT